MSALFALLLSVVLAGEDTFPLDDSGAFKSLEASDTDTDADEADTDASGDTYPSGGEGVAALTDEPGGCACAGGPSPRGVVGAVSVVAVMVGVGRRRR